MGKIRSDARSRGPRGGIDHKASQSWPKEARRARRFARAGCLMQAWNTNKHNWPRVSKQAACVEVAGCEFAGRGRRRSSRRTTAIECAAVLIGMGNEVVVTVRPGEQADARCERKQARRQRGLNKLALQSGSIVAKHANNGN